MLRGAHALVPVLACVAGILNACAASATAERSAAPADELDRRALAAIDEARIRPHVERLASDAFEGRAPGEAGDDSTVAYISAELRRLGVGPGNTDGTWVQRVPLRGTSFRSTEVSLRIGDASPRRLAFPS